jgi:hypothetical protein
VDRNFQVAFMMADYLATDHPKLSRDIFWGVRCPELPYTKGTMRFKTDRPFCGSAAYIQTTKNAADEEESEYLWTNATLVIRCLNIQAYNLHSSYF